MADTGAADAPAGSSTGAEPVQPESRRAKPEDSPVEAFADCSDPGIAGAAAACFGACPGVDRKAPHTSGNGAAAGAIVSVPDQAGGAISGPASASEMELLVFPAAEYA